MDHGKPQPHIPKKIVKPGLSLIARSKNGKDVVVHDSLLDTLSTSAAQARNTNAPNSSTALARKKQKHHKLERLLILHSSIDVVLIFLDFHETFISIFSNSGFSPSRSNPGSNATDVRAEIMGYSKQARQRALALATYSCDGARQIRRGGHGSTRRVALRNDREW